MENKNPGKHWLADQNRAILTGFDPQTTTLMILESHRLLLLLMLRHNQYIKAISARILLFYGTHRVGTRTLRTQYPRAVMRPSVKCKKWFIKFFVLLHFNSAYLSGQDWSLSLSFVLAAQVNRFVFLQMPPQSKIVFKTHALGRGRQLAVSFNP